MGVNLIFSSGGVESPPEVPKSGVAGRVHLHSILGYYSNSILVYLNQG